MLRDHLAGLRERFNAEAEALCTSDVVLYGAECSARPAEVRREVERLAARLGVLPFDGDAAG